MGFGSTKLAFLSFFFSIMYLCYVMCISCTSTIKRFFYTLQNSNILSAVLCLVKELDAPSLEVAEMAIRCRMEELDD